MVVCSLIQPVQYIYRCRLYRYILRNVRINRQLNTLYYHIIRFTFSVSYLFHVKLSSTDYRIGGPDLIRRDILGYTYAHSRNHISEGANSDR